VVGGPRSEEHGRQMAAGIVVTVWRGILSFSSPWHIDLPVAVARLCFAIE
jgi:hypothetical protein